MADRAEQDGVVRPQPLERVRRHHPAVGEVVLRAPVEIRCSAARTHGRRGRVEHAAGGGHDFRADSISRDYGDLKHSMVEEEIIHEDRKPVFTRWQVRAGGRR